MSKTLEMKQPRVFYLACITTACERFGFYVLSFLLVLYAKSAFHLSDMAAFALFAIFNALIYITPAIGGYLADNIFGIRRSMVLGLLLEAIGLAILSIPDKTLFPISLVFIILGVGYFKTAPTNLMARGYEEEDIRIDAGFTLYYMIMNIGGFFSPVVAGYLQYYYGWHVAFGAASIVLFLSILFYYLLRKSADQDDSAVGMIPLKKRTWIGIVIGTLAFGLVCLALLTHPHLTDFFFAITAIVISLYFLFEIIRSPKDEKYRIIACLILIAAGTMFFILYYQLFTAMTLFVNRSAQRTFFGFHLPTTLFMAFNPIWVVVLSPVLAWLYEWLGKYGKDLSVATKFPLGLLITSLAFFTLMISTNFPNTMMKVSPFWFILAMLFFSLGELLISALGVAMVTRIAPKRMYGFMMGSWFLVACALGSTLSGQVADLAEVPKNMVMHPQMLLIIYHTAFGKMGLIGLGGAIVFFMLSPIVKRIAHLH